jgi:hypothetical protein
MGGVLRSINHGRIADHGQEIRHDVASKLEKAGETLNKVYNLDGGAFSITGTACAVAYPGALQFAFNTLRTHIKQANGFADKLDATARNWQRCEEKNTFTV